MKMFYGKTPVKSMNIKHYELDTNSATMKPSDLQSGITAFAKGKKVTGTGKSFEFANYGAMHTNLSRYVPNNINVIEISSLDYPIQTVIALNEMQYKDFSIKQHIGNVIINDSTYSISAQVLDSYLIISCDETIQLQVFYGKDNYV